MITRNIHNNYSYVGLGATPDPSCILMVCRK